jgi:hypothetical protein
MNRKKRPVPPQAAIDKFWQMVETVGWKNNPDYNKARKALMAQYTAEETEEFSNVYVFLAQQLREADKDTEDRVGVLGCNDTSDDLTAHIIGCGKEEYEANIRDPRKIRARLEADDYQESFSYCLPHSSDYALQDPKTFQRRAEEIVAKLQQGLQDDNFEPVYPQMNALIAHFQPSITGNPLELLPNKAEILDLQKAIRARGDQIWCGCFVRDGSHFAFSYLVENTLRDIETYLAE